MVSFRRYPRKKISKSSRRLRVVQRKHDRDVRKQSLDLLIDKTSVALNSTHSWFGIPPLSQYNINLQLQLRKGVKSLKQLCAESLARNVDSLDAEYLSEAPSECWLLVWNKILELSNDSFRVYSIFASKFSHSPGFKAHKLTMGDPLGSLDEVFKLLLLRSDAISMLRIPNCRNYRLENLFGNLKMESIISELSMLNPLTLLDVSAAELTQHDYYMLFNFPRLIALDMSRSKFVDDLYIHNMVQSMLSEGKLSLLTTLSLTNCRNLSLDGVMELLKSETNLSYIECDHALRVSHQKVGGQRYVLGTKWFLIDREVEELAIIERLPLGLKMHALFKYFSKSVDEDEAFLLKDTLDIMIHPLSFDFKLDLQTKVKLLQQTWKARTHRRSMPNLPLKSFAYFYNSKHTVIEQKPVRIVKVESPQGVKRKSEDSGRKIKRRMVADAKSFFG